MWVSKGVDGLNTETGRQPKKEREKERERNSSTFHGNYEIVAHFKLANNMSNNLKSYINVCLFIHVYNMYVCVCVIAVFMALLLDGH